MTMATIPPKLTPEDRLAGSRKALEARCRRRDAKAAVLTGTMSLYDVLASDDEAVRRMRVLELLRIIPGYGRARSAALLKRLGIAESRRIGGLGPHQREALLRETGPALARVSDGAR